ncbi:MAG: SDR family oxidoreductase [Candidatus Sumerlaeota bacterium]
MDTNLKGKTALVTGSSAGIGYAIALELARLGAVVVVNSRTEKRNEEAATKIRAEVSNAAIRTITADLGTADGVAALVKQLPAVDILVNNVGIFEPKDFFSIPDEDWMRFFEVNVMSGVRLSRAYIPAMEKAGWGRVVFISSESGQQIPTEMIHYGMTKTAQIAIARGLAEGVKDARVTVNSVLVGPSASEGVSIFVDQLAKEQGISTAEMEKRFFESARPTSVLQRFIKPEEVANMVAYLCTPAASATTGTAVRVDGGVVRSIL